MYWHSSAQYHTINAGASNAALLTSHNNGYLGLRLKSHKLSNGYRDKASRNMNMR